MISLPRWGLVCVDEGSSPSEPEAGVIPRFTALPNASLGWELDRVADEDEGEEDTSVNGRIPREARKDGRRDEGGVGKTTEYTVSTAKEGHTFNLPI